MARPRKHPIGTRIPLAKKDSSVHSQVPRDLDEEVQIQAIGYIRTDPDDAGLSSAAQRAKLEFYADDANVTLLEVFEDPAVSADVAFDKRPGLARAVHAAAKEAVALVLVVDQDRIATSPLKGLFWEHMLDERAGARFKTVDGHYPQWNGEQTDTAKELLAAFGAAQQAVDDAVQFGDSPDDWAVIEAAKNLGVEKRNTDSKTGLPIKVKLSLREIAQALEDRGFTTRHGTRYSPSHVSRMLDMHTPQELNRKAQGDRDSGKDKEKLKRPSEAVAV